MFRGVVLLPVFLALASCSVKKYAINQLGNALAGTGDSFASDGDPDLIRQAAPFSLKLVESLLAENPRHEGLLLAPAPPRSIFAPRSFIYAPATTGCAAWRFTIKISPRG